MPSNCGVLALVLVPALAFAQGTDPDVAASDAAADGGAPVSAPDAAAPGDQGPDATASAAAPAPDAAARELYLRGDRAYAEGSYEAALRDFSEAFRLSERPALLFNMANAHERLGQFAEAKTALERYLPEAGSRTELVRKRIAGLEERIRKLEKQRRAEAQRRKRELAAASTPEDTVSRPWLGYALLGVGAVSLGVGTYFAFGASSARQDADELCVGDPAVCPRAAEEALSRDRRDSVLADVGWGVGLTAAVVGLYLVLTHDPAPAPRSTAPLAIVPRGDDGAGIVFSGAF